LWAEWWVAPWAGLWALLRVPKTAENSAECSAECSVGLRNLARKASHWRGQKKWADVSAQSKTEPWKALHW